MYSIDVASITIFAIVFVYCKVKVGAKFANPIGQKDLSYLLIKNVPVRTANMVQMLRGPLTTTVLSYFPAGFLTLYSYADKIMTTLLGTTNSPLAQFYYIRASELSSRKSYADIKPLLVETVRSSVILFGGMFFMTAIMFQKVFGLLFAGKVPSGGVETMFLLFLSLFPFYYISLIGTELGMTALSMKKGRFVFYSSGTFIVILGASLIPLVRVLSIYGLPIGLAAGQIFAVIVYAISISNLHPIIDFNFYRVQMNTIAIALLMIAANFLSANSISVQIGASASLFLVWLLINGKSAVAAMRFMTTKGEVR
jgi:O-antigen/teichoic acid export membrane protein